MTQFLRLLSDESGQGILEYTLIISIVSVAAFAALTALGSKSNNTLLAPAASAMPG